MILVDTSVWVDFFRRGDDLLAGLLEDGEVLMHPYVVGELACGFLPSRQQVMVDLSKLPTAPVAKHSEVLHFIDNSQLAGTGVGYLDCHLLVSTLLGDGTRLWSRDKKLAALASRFSLLH